jgi:hypothetical protein
MKKQGLDIEAYLIHIADDADDVKISAHPSEGCTVIRTEVF